MTIPLMRSLGLIAALALPLAACQQPVAPAATAAAVAPANKSFMVFFDLGKSALSARAKAVVQDAAATAKATAHTAIEVNGYTDTSGSTRANAALAMRRAKTVAAALVKAGVPKQEIAIKAFGETVLLVPTGDNVKEPQNRRVEIIIR